MAFTVIMLYFSFSSIFFPCSSQPSLQEFAHLSSENRQLRETQDQVKTDIFIMGQKIKELEKELLFYKSKKVWYILLW